MGLKILGGFLFLALLLHPVQALSVTPSGSYSSTLMWDANPSSDQVVGYRVHYGTSSRSYPNRIEAGNGTASTISGLTGGVTYFFAVTAYDADGLESGYSQEVTYVPGLPGVRTIVTPGGQVVLGVQGSSGRTYEILATQTLADWTIIGSVTLGASGSILFTDINAASYQKRFYRVREMQP